MSALVECVPNFSEGRDPSKVNQIAAAIRSIPGAYVLDIHMDPDHNRSVITFVGSCETIGGAALRAVGEAVALIDLNRHQGEHPRIGAADVVPFTPVHEATLNDCVRIAHETGKEIYRRFQVPVYFYEAAALQPGRRNLENIRRGGFEGLKSQVASDPSRQPDVGGPQLHPTAGATAVGARGFLIAFNVNLDSSDRKIAQEIARKIRSSAGGLPALKAMGMLLKSRSTGGQAGQAPLSRGAPPLEALERSAVGGQAQVSMNLTDFEKTSLADAFGAVEQEAARLGVSVASSELVGLVPQKALVGINPEALKIVNFHPLKILENKLAEVLPAG